ncbi:MAG TPA: polynucleotide adenylyltransferase PcnB [Kiritimatiellia bacterium]|nr:polynucleotide adenylyltransferase PcnB [Kiritimatiellia bacterium]OQC55811.1 MAG: Poly(A) polymerase I precursor [Verrucomicrobia bacterium ADurb.Bin018]HOE01334.1 polynucleotide adenylyltransferase PcnB [Kiritimatiellia bacterium]HOE37864.1 polynucleotide adenylyltransferase PcnB [Kiritimatiellia bacterium]HOR75233.1 polynucleotide adenylyltransferase PcnB [Kiritimatiellia bacterium]
MKDDPVILTPDQHGLKQEDIAWEALRVLTRLDEAGYKAYLCGGGVRDLLLKRKPKDFDIATDARPEEVKKLFRNCRIIGRRFKLAHVFFRDVIIETATFRALLDNPPPEAEGVPLPSRRRQDVPDPIFATRDGVIVRDNVYGSPEEDARRRDFTINGLFYNIADGTIIDYVGGLEDLQRRVVRVIGDPAVRFHEDPVRMVRAVRIAAQLDFEIERQARDAIVEMAGELKYSSRERLHEEILKILNCGCALKAFERAWRKGLFQTIYPAYAQWLQGPDRQPAMQWIKKALRQFDVWKQAGLKPMPALQHALLFGPFLEGLAADNTAEDLPEFEATLQAVNTVLRDKSNLTQIPKAVVYDVERILGIQVQMRKSSGQSKYATRLRHRNGFNEALIYLKFAGGVDPSRKELLARWMTPPAPHHNPPARPNAPPSAPEHPTRAQPAASAHEHKPRAIPSVPAPAAE